MKRSEAYLEGSILYIDGVEWGVDYTLQEAIEEIEKIKDLPDAPTGVRVFSRPRTRRKGHPTGTGWPMSLAPVFSSAGSTGTGWPE